MKFDDYQQKTKRTEPDTTGRKLEALVNYAMGMSGESGEITDHIKKVFFQGHDLNITDMVYELGDVLYYVARFADLIGYDLSEIAKMNEYKLQQRYPNGFSVEASRNRSDA